MAQKIELIDDLDGSTPAEVIRFGFAGQSYEIDLSESNADKLHQSLLPYILKAQKVATRPSRGRPLGKNSQGSVVRNPEIDKIRAWAQEEGIELNKRGRISAKITEQYRNRETNKNN